MEVPEITTACPACRPLLEQQHAIIKSLLEQVEKLTKRLEAVEREGKRQAAPFRKKLKPNPKKPGRKSGDDHGKHHRRNVPERIDESYDVPLPPCCPGCGHNELTKTETVVQYQTEIPRTVIHRQFNIDAGTCSDCGAKVQGRSSAANVGCQRCRCRAVWPQSSLRSGASEQRAWTEPRQGQTPQVIGDETGWRVAGRSAWLHAFVGLTATCLDWNSRESLDTMAGRSWSEGHGRTIDESAGEAGASSEDTSRQ